MAGRSKKSDIKYVQYAFPEDYKQLNSIIAFQNGKVKLDNENINDFCIHPEYDLPYKILSMYLSETERYDSINQMYKPKNEKESNLRRRQSVDINLDDSLYIRTKKKYEWKDYIFQTPGIFDMLGIKREFKLTNQKNFEENNDIQENSVNKVIQNPILFLSLINIRLNDEEVLLDDEILDIINKSILAYNEKKDSNEFNKLELENCYRGLFGEFPSQGAFAALKCNESIAKVEDVVSTIVDNYWNKIVKKETEIKCDSKEGEGISIPKYMRSIFIVFYEYYDCLPLIRTDIKLLWNTYEKFYLMKNIDEATGLSFFNILQYMIYRLDAKTFYESFFEEYVFRTETPEESIKIKIEKPLIEYYTFCLLILFRIKCEKTDYKDIAKYTFERIFSLYLFDVETKILYSTIDNTAKTIIKYTSYKTTLEALKLKLAECVYNNFSSKVLHKIYCSPGIYHRVKLANYMNELYDFIDTSGSLYMFEKTFGEKCLCQKIDEINRSYFDVEKFYIHTTIFKDKDNITKEEILTDCKKNMKSDHFKEYQEYYEGLLKKIEKYNSKQDKVGFRKSDAYKIAKEIVESQQAEYKILHFRIIFSSLLSKENSIVELES